MVGKIMKNHPKKTYEELKQILTNKIAKFELTEDQVESFTLLRNDFPKMAEFVMKKVICNNPQSDLKQLKKKLENKREENRKEKMEYMKSRSKSFEKCEMQCEPNWYGKADPHWYGKGHGGPHGYGKGHKGPHGYGKGYGKGYGGPHGYGKEMGGQGENWWMN